MSSHLAAPRRARDPASASAPAGPDAPGGRPRRGMGAVDRGPGGIGCAPASAGHGRSCRCSRTARRMPSPPGHRCQGRGRAVRRATGPAAARLVVDAVSVCWTKSAAGALPGRRRAAPSCRTVRGRRCHRSAASSSDPATAGRAEVPRRDPCPAGVLDQLPRGEDRRPLVAADGARGPRTHVRSAAREGGPRGSRLSVTVAHVTSRERVSPAAEGTSRSRRFSATTAQATRPTTPATVERVA